MRFVALAVVWVCLIGSGFAESPQESRTIEQPLAFEPNRGQAAPDVLKGKNEVGFVQYDTDGLVTKIAPDGSGYNTVIGTSNALAVDHAGMAFLTGDTSSLDMPVTPDARQKEPDFCRFANHENAFLMKIGPGPSPASTPTYTSIEQDHASVQYTGSWNTNSSPNAMHTRRLAALSAGQGARATVTFTGVGITWMGFKDQYSGIADVYLDGVLLGEVDTYRPAEQYQYPLFTIDGLTNGTHTLVIEVTGRKNPSSLAPWIWVDAFVIQRSGAAASGSAKGFTRQELPPASATDTTPFTGSAVRFSTAQRRGGLDTRIRIPASRA